MNNMAFLLRLMGCLHVCKLLLRTLIRYREDTDQETAPWRHHSQKYHLQRFSLFCVLTSILSHLMTSSVPNLHNTKNIEYLVQDIVPLCARPLSWGGWWWLAMQARMWESESCLLRRPLLQQVWTLTPKLQNSQARGKFSVDATWARFCQGGQRRKVTWERDKGHLPWSGTA